jgi:hypothetical protein
MIFCYNTSVYSESAAKVTLKTKKNVFISFL